MIFFTDRCVISIFVETMEIEALIEALIAAAALYLAKQWLRFLISLESKAGQSGRYHYLRLQLRLLNGPQRFHHVALREFLAPMSGLCLCIFFVLYSCMKSMPRQNMVHCLESGCPRWTQPGTGCCYIYINLLISIAYSCCQGIHKLMVPNSLVYMTSLKSVGFCFLYFRARENSVLILCNTLRARNHVFNKLTSCRTSCSTCDHEAGLGLRVLLSRNDITKDHGLQFSQSDHFMRLDERKTITSGQIRQAIPETFPQLRCSGDPSESRTLSTPRSCTN